MKTMVIPEVNRPLMNAPHIFLASVLAKWHRLYFLSSQSIPSQTVTVLDVALLEKIRFQILLAPRFLDATRGIVSFIVA